MEKKVVNVAIIGLGGRGGYAYSPYLLSHKDEYHISAICDIDPIRLEKWGDIMGVPSEGRFLSDEEFFKEKRGDVLIIATLDRLHVTMAKKALKLGYHLLLEKPISNSKDEIDELLDAAHETDRTIMVCHELRYTVWIKKLKEILDSGAIGRLISIDHTENVVYWHQAHSFVRGNWHSKEETAPMIMAKCCHDMDLLQYFAESRCKSISSMGDLRYFKKENKPAGAADRCVNCKYVDSCTYSAKSIYIDDFIASGQKQAFPWQLITDANPVTEEALWESIKTGRYGKCVFSCDNDVVDNETTIMTFENGVTATLKMEAFVKYGGRDIRFFGTDGELLLEEGNDIIVLKPFRGTDKVWKISELTDDLEGHGGGDAKMLEHLYKVIALGDKSVDTSIDASAESHYMALAAEKSRENNGQIVLLNEFRKH